MVQSMTRWIGILVALTAFAVPAQAQDDPGEIVRHCVAAMERTTGHTVHAIADATERGIHIIQRLDREGASDEELIRAAHRATHAVNSRARRGSHIAHGIAARCVEALRETDAGPRYYRIIRGALQESLETINGARERGAHAIAAALHEALNN